MSVVTFELDGSDVVEFAIDSTLVERVDVLDVLEVAPRSYGAEQLGLASPFTDSARQVSYESPMLPTDGRVPISARRSV